MSFRGITRIADLRRRLLQRFGPSVELNAASRAGVLLVSPPGSLEQAREVLQQVLFRSMLPFWLGDMLDPAGGYRLHHDVRGRWRGSAPKRLVTQARTLWFLARLISHGHPAPKVPAMARHGLTLLADRFWDGRHGGFSWELDATGGHATMTDKHAYGQAQALYALSEYALATGCTASLDLARRTFQVLDEHFYDRRHGGYREFFRADWSAAPAGVRGYLGAPPAWKLLNTHIHLLEALQLFLRLTGDVGACERVEELGDLLCSTFLHLSHATLTGAHERDWTPVDQGARERSSYGHDIEAVHLLMAADQELGHPHERRIDLYRRLFENAVRFGEDIPDGGFWSSGRPGHPASDRRKIWWVQAEALLASLELYRLTGEQAFLKVFLRTLGWVQRWQVDWQGGDWHAEVVRGRAYGVKAGPWKDPYHNGRAVICSVEILNRMIDARNESALQRGEASSNQGRYEAQQT